MDTNKKRFRIGPTKEKGITGMFNGGFIELFLCGETSRHLECEEPLRCVMPMRIK